MQQHERLKTICTLLAQKGEVKINDLADLFMISKVTLRKDLDLLQEQGVLQRVYGGAVSTRTDVLTVIKSALAEGTAVSEIQQIRQRIAAAAARHVSDGDAIFLGSGITCELLAKELQARKDLTIITNNVSALSDLIPFAKKVIIIGGEITTVDNVNFFSWIDTPSKYLENIFVNYAFTSCTGFDLKAGLTVDSITSTYLYKSIPDIKKKWFLMVDHFKFNKIGLYLINSLSSIDCVISDNIPDNYRQCLEEHKIEMEKA